MGYAIWGGWMGCDVARTSLSVAACIQAHAGLPTTAGWSPVALACRLPMVSGSGTMQHRLPGARRKGIAASTCPVSRRIMTTSITVDILESFLQCRYKAQTQHSCHQPQTHLPCESDSENKASCWAFVRRLRRVYEGGGISGAMCSVSLPYPASSGGSMSRRVCMSNWKCP